MQRFIILSSTKDFNLIQSDLDGLFEQIIHITKRQSTLDTVTYIYDHDLSFDMEEMILNILADMLQDLKLYQSRVFTDEKKLMEHHAFIMKNFEHIPNNVGPFIDDRMMLQSLFHLSTEVLRFHFLGKYATDSMMHNTLKVYFEEDQNMIRAAKNLYIHRNTLIQRLDKFYEETGFDPRRFRHAVLIYRLMH